MTFKVFLLDAAEEDLDRLYDFVLERELTRDGDFHLADQAVGAVRAAIDSLRHHPFTCRKVGGSSFTRALVIPFGNAGYLAMFEIVSNEIVLITAIRHQREDDYH